MAGTCPQCDLEARIAELEAERDELRTEVERLRDAIREIAAAGFDSTRNEIAREALDRMKP